MKKFEGLVWMFLLLTILLWAFLIVAQAAAPTVLTIDGSTSWERGRIERLEHQLNFTKVAMPDTWNIHIIPEEQFIENKQLLKLNTMSAYTYVATGQTYLNEGYLGYADDLRVRQTLAHEAGHMICQCISEDKANDIAWVLEK